MLTHKPVLCWLATVDARNRPNVSPKEIFAEIAEDHLVIADIASAGTVRNIRANPEVCVSMIDIFLQRGCKLDGTAEIIAADHPEHPALCAPLTAMAGGHFPIRHVISVHVTRRSPILAPSYTFFPTRSEAEMRADAYRSYGVQPAATGR
ncbi:pyridoxamine 5'-phosphate oxidase family protein [Phaeovulum sp. W22_SRMD_FR3]|uniref:pyridoxamine 5'-phosphate oxidase family protein n=1 Tax=Phaeovulum sp. W22_SRMD_FR3 TaxID=3240274 RepID=UPI003F9A9307